MNTFYKLLTTSSLLALVILPSRASELYFEPEDGIREQMVKRINRTRSSIDLSLSSFDFGDMTKALARATRRGVNVRVVEYVPPKNHENKALIDKGIEIHIISHKEPELTDKKFVVFDGNEVCTDNDPGRPHQDTHPWQSYLCTTQSDLTEDFQAEFEVLWNAPAHRLGNHPAENETNETLKDGTPLSAFDSKSPD